VSSFRLICIAALTAASVVFVLKAAAAQSATDQAGKSYLAGLRPPHEHSKAAHGKTSHPQSPQKPAAKSTQQTAKRQPVIAAKSKTHHRPVRLAEKINSRVAWPSVEPAAADQPATSENVLQFATEDATSAWVTPPRTASTAAAAPRVTMPAPAAAAPKTVPPVNIAANNERDHADAADKLPDATPVVPAQRLEAPAPRQMRVITPALSEAPAAASTSSDQPAARSRSAAAQMLATLAGAVAACIVAFLIFGFGSARIRQI
jgi:hypothetical protein